MNRTEILNLFANCDFHKKISIDSFEKIIIDYLPGDFNYYSYEYGQTKVCIIPEHENFVIKVPFNCTSCDFRHYRANSSDDFCWDYCFTEILLYKKAKKLKKILCETKLIGFMHGYPIYIQERATPYSEMHPDDLDGDRYTTSYYERYDSITNGKMECCFGLNWFEEAIAYYGKEFMIAVDDFFIDAGIDDFHNGNLGYIGNRPVILDYSGYKED